MSRVSRAEIDSDARTGQCHVVLYSETIDGRVVHQAVFRGITSWSIMDGVAWSPDGARLAYAAYGEDSAQMPNDAYALVWERDPRTGLLDPKPLRLEYPGRACPDVHDLCWSADGGLLAVRGEMELVYCWCFPRGRSATNSVAEKASDARHSHLPWPGKPARVAESRQG